MNGSTPLALGFSLPSTWCNLSLDAERDAIEVAEQVDNRIAREPELAPARRALLDLFLGWAETATHLGATMAAMRWDEDAAFGVAMATLLVFRLERDDSLPMDVELAQLHHRLTQDLPSDQHPPHVERVDLAIGPSVRMEAVRDPVADGTETRPLRFVLQYWIPLDGTADMFEVEATTSNLALAPNVTAEVDGIVASFALRTP